MSRPTKIVCKDCGSTDLELPAWGKMTPHGFEVTLIDKALHARVCNYCEGIGAEEVEYFNREEEIESHLLHFYEVMEIDKPEEHDKILDFVTLELKNSDPDFWGRSDVGRALWKWVELK